MAKTRTASAGERTYQRDARGRFAAASRQPESSPEERRSSRKATQEEADTDVEGEKLRLDLGPWAETPNSTRVSSYRYDYLKRETQVTWRNNNNPGYAYEDMDYESFRQFARVVSKGKYINSTLNGFPYRRLTPDEVQAPSNRDRRGVSRARA